MFFVAYTGITTRINCSRIEQVVWLSQKNTVFLNICQKATSRMIFILSIRYHWLLDNLGYVCNNGFKIDFEHHHSYVYFSCMGVCSVESLSVQSNRLSRRVLLRSFLSQHFISWDIHEKFESYSVQQRV